MDTHRDTHQAEIATPTRAYVERRTAEGKTSRETRRMLKRYITRELYRSARREALPGWLHFYNHHRPHSAIGALPPISRLNNVPGHHT